ncbi:hypothetical protein RHMOL_Rhmol11G0216000 [Rhododendron molle]|uniref:Uncharacterized protein n=1 Tax=Rhododendron molle TaxID=49168 RepID=A0ACC0LW25_RHOML|nr:hypothetical protein RHMOL_Rhmol11G0216000 [Rhododendron molle]
MSSAISPAASAAAPSEPFLSKPVVLPTAAGKGITCEAARLDASDLRKHAIKPITVAAALGEGEGKGGDSGGWFGAIGSIVIKAIKVTSDEKLKKSKKKKEHKPIASEPVSRRQSKRRRLQEESVLTSTDEGVYQPKTKETMAAYEALLGVIQQQFGGQPPNIVSGAADEILAVLKNETIKTQTRRRRLRNC